MPTVELTEEQYACVCGAVAESHDVDVAAIYSEAWVMLQAKFPLAAFTAYAAAHSDFYRPEE